MKKKVIFSGIQPTGNLHIGNYLGAVKNWVALQNSGEYDCYFAVVDYHSLTGDMKPQDRHDQIVRTAVELIAAGIDPEKSTLFIQSQVSAHAELAWIFNCITPMAELERMTQFKDKSARQEKNINVGLFTYPSLMSADILLYHGTHIPVGEDQIQHVELTRSTARWFNNKYGDYFTEPELMITETPRIKSLLEPIKKMSKSLGAGHVIELADSPEIIEKKLKKAVTASEGDASAPGVDNLLLLMKHFATEDQFALYTKAVADGTVRYGDLKSDLAEALANKFSSFREKREALLSNHDVIAEQLFAGAERAQATAQKTMDVVKEMIGLR
ncbi:tryptophan--tRNA ligase [Patescibacteria group bacterium]|nr:tryptophan--tRNA ligase [Patescibacteria group bacterium]MBU1721528.1 tryptophan--tRNA ligase [Patescibacteria group bacterium]MBU1901494.1 tryptophan--tRNA ligase [Patescibacteria group bacterium]